MFGRSWGPATATIVARKAKRTTDTSGTWEYVADIAPSAGAPFRTTLKQPPLMSHVVRLNVGETVNVLADTDHRRAKFDRSDPRISGKGRKRAEDTFDAALAQPPNSPPPRDSAGSP